MENNIKLIRTMFALDIIANVIAETPSDITIDSALVIYTEPNLDEMKQLLYMYPWLTTSLVENIKQSVTVPKHMIAFVTNVKEDIITHHSNVWESIMKEEETYAEEMEELRKGSESKIVSFDKKKKPTNVH